MTKKATTQTVTTRMAARKAAKRGPARAQSKLDTRGIAAILREKEREAVRELARLGLGVEEIYAVVPFTRVQIRRWTRLAS